MQPLTPETASAFATLALAGIAREFPNKLDHVINGPGEVQSPRALHPAFYGCFDWHSCVHTHWLLARLLRLFPDLAQANQIASSLEATLNPGAIAGEIAYLQGPNRGSFERTYGWAWLLKLGQELRLARSQAWATALRPLEDAFVARYLAYLPKATYPIRTGVHPNSAFGLAFAHDYALATEHQQLRALVEATALRFFGPESDCPAHTEPGGADFFSPALMEADLMRRILPRPEFASWFVRFLPRARHGEPAPLFTPAHVSDRRDLQIVHLDGLNLSRAWCLRSIARSLPDDERLASILEVAAERHAAAALPHVLSGDYAGEHWLATFALLLLSGDA